MYKPFIELLKLDFKVLRFKLLITFSIIYLIDFCYLQIIINIEKTK